jgi:hypothetical protein
MPLKQLVQLSEPELAALDVAVIQNICAQGLPGAEDLRPESGKQTLDEMARTVGQRTCECEWMFRQKPRQFQNSRAFFQAVALTTVIQRDFGVRTIAEEGLWDKKVGWKDSRNLFLHGLLEGRPGTCSNIPILFAALGRRLGYPLRTVAVPRHQLLRWDDSASGERFNIECTTLGFSSPSDFYFAIWPPGAERCRFEGTTWLKSLTCRQELAHFLIQRACCLNAHQRHGEAADACAWAWRLDAEHRPHLETLETVIAEWKAAVLSRFVLPYPPVSISGGRLPNSLLPQALERAMISLEVLDDLANDQEFRTVIEPRFRHFARTAPARAREMTITVNYRDQSTCEWDERKPLRRT